MSHVVTIKTEVRDPAAVAAACCRLGLADPKEGTTRLYEGEVQGLNVQLADWRYPVVCQLDVGTIAFDNFEGRWGDRAQLDRFLQVYAVEKAKLEARRAGHLVTEQPLHDGSVKVTIHVGGRA